MSRTAPEEQFLAKAAGISASSVQRIWRAHGLGSLPTTFADTQRLFVHAEILPGDPIELRRRRTIDYRRVHTQ